jgi:hypothetical protein
MRHWFQKFTDAKTEAKARHPTATFKRVGVGGWMGNGFGAAPATYAMLNHNGEKICLIWSTNRNDGWTVADQTIG